MPTLALVVLLVASLAGCVVGTPRPQVTVTAPAPSPSVTTVTPPTETVYTASPSPTEETTGYEESPDDGGGGEVPSDGETTEWPTPTDDVHLTGSVVFVNRVGSGACSSRPIRDVILDTTDEGVRGIRGVQFHDKKWGIGQTLYVGKRIDIVIPPDDYKPIVLQRGGEPFPTTPDRCDVGSVPDHLYGHTFIMKLPYNAKTWHTV